VKSYILKKNLFIFDLYPEIFEIEDSLLIIGSEKNLKKLNLNDFDTIFTLFYLPIWIKHILALNQINLIYLDDFGRTQKVYLHKRLKRTHNKLLEMDKSLNLLESKARTIDNIFKTSEAQAFLDYSLNNKIDIYTINENLNFIPKAIIMDAIKLNYKLTNKRASQVTNTLFNLTENIVSYSFYNKFIELGLNPENGFLNQKSPSLIRDLTEIQRLKFLKKLHYLFESRFFEKIDLNRKHFPKTVIKFVKILSTYFFYANRFKRVRELLYLAECFKRGKQNEIFSSL